MIRIPSIATCVLTLLALVGGLDAQTATTIMKEVHPIPLCHQFQAPAPAVLGATDIDVFPNGYQVAGGPFVSAATNYPLVEAVLAAESVYTTKQATVVLEVHGAIPANGNGMQFGGGDAGLKAYRAYWPSAPIDVAIRGATGPGADVIYAFAIMRNLSNGTVTPGVKRFRVENVEIRSQSFTNAIVSTPKGAQAPSLANGKWAFIQIYNCRFARGAGNPKWGARYHGRCRWDFRDNHYEYVVEHCVYADSPQGNSFFIRNTMDGSTRTMLQVVNRAIDNPGPSGFGTLLIEGNLATNVDLDGGSDFTVVGHLGCVIFRNNFSYEDSSLQVGSQGSIVVWSDASKGLYTNANGFTTNAVVVQHHHVQHPNADRSHIAIAGAERVEVGGRFVINGNRTAFDFDNAFGGPIATGSICFFQPSPLSQYPGFQSATKVKIGGVVLTNAQIDALVCP